MEQTNVDAFEVLESVNVKVGDCTVEELMKVLNPCMRQFYMKYRTDPNTDCMSNYNSMRDCVRNEVKQCFSDTDADDQTVTKVSESIVMESLPDEDAPKFCDRSGIDPPLEPDGDHNIYCTKEFYSESEAVTNEFNELFRKDRGSPSLCKSYEVFGRKYLELTRTKCRPGFYRFVQKQMNWAESRDLNPFCSEDQIHGDS